MRHEFVPKGQFVFRQGDYGDKFYIIIRGKVQVLEMKEDYIRMKKEAKQLKEEKEARRKLKELNKGYHESTYHAK
jgi:CRP-like cAMP-binding protein